jgi:hypothetical protein
VAFLKIEMNGSETREFVHLVHARAGARRLPDCCGSAGDQELHVVDVVISFQVRVDQLVEDLFVHSFCQQRPSLYAHTNYWGKKNTISCSSTRNELKEPARFRVRTQETRVSSS